MAATWDADRRLLEASGFSVTVLRERPAFVEASSRKVTGLCYFNRLETVLIGFFRSSSTRILESCSIPST